MPDEPLNSTPLSIRVLQQVLDTHEWKQQEFAERARLSRSTLSMHLSGQRPVRDDQLVCYLRALDRQERQMLVAAWLRDVVDPDIAVDILDPAVNRIAEEIKDWSPELDVEQKKMLTWWTHELTRDKDLDLMFRSLSRRAGYEDPP